MNETINEYILSYIFNRVNIDSEIKINNRSISINEFTIIIPNLKRQEETLDVQILNQSVNFNRYDKNLKLKISDNDLRLNFDIIGEVYDHLTLKREEDADFDLNSIQVFLPVMDMKIYYFFSLLRPYINYSINQFNNKPFSIGISHDIDRTGDSYIYRLITYFFQTLKQKRPSLLVKGIFRKNEEFNIDEIINIENSFNAKATWFILSLYGLKNNADYKLKSKYYKKAIKLLNDSKHELGLHIPFMDLSINNINSEFSKLPSGSKKGVRMHHLRGKFKELMNMFNDSDVKYDSTFGFNEVISYRFGTSIPFNPIIDDKILKNIVEIPLNIMDLQISDIDKFKKDITVLFDVLKEVGGVCILNWHNNRFNITKYGTIWKESFKIALEEANNRNAWIGNLEEIVDYYSIVN